MGLQYLFMPILFAGLVFISCENGIKSNDDQTADLLLIDTKSDNGLQVELLVYDSLIVGLNDIYFRLTDESSNTIITDANVTQSIIMHMSDRDHSCPFVDPKSTANENDLFEGEIVFTMASGMMGTWHDTVSIHNEDSNTMHKVVFENFTVTETNMKKDLVYTDSDSNQIFYIVTLNGLVHPEVGNNDFTLTVHKMESMMSFPAVSDMEITITPLMPSMGHGSGGNVNPVYTENGKYEGIVVFNMTGDWTVDFSFVLNGNELGAVQYEFNI